MAVNIWQKKYRILEEMMIRKMQWSFSPEWSKRLIRQDIREGLSKKKRSKNNTKKVI